MPKRKAPKSEAVVEAERVVAKYENRVKEAKTALKQVVADSKNNPPAKE